MHAARFTRFCDRGDIGANCWCAGGRDAAAIGDASWLWQHFAGAPCAALDGDRCDCTACGGAFDDCPHEGCWQCLGVRPPRLLRPLLAALVRVALRVAAAFLPLQPDGA